MFIITQSGIANVRNNLILTLAIIMVWTSSARANPASDRAFASCVTAASAQFADHGNRIDSVIMETRSSNQHSFRITSSADQSAAGTLLCSAAANRTSIEVISPRLASTNTR